MPFPDEYQGVYQQRRRECARQLYESIGIARGDRIVSQQQTLRNFSLFDAPHVAIITSDRALGTYGAVDCGGYRAFRIGRPLCGARPHGEMPWPEFLVDCARPRELSPTVPSTVKQFNRDHHRLKVTDAEV